MVELEQILPLLKAQKSAVLHYAQLAMSPYQFKSFRKLFLDQSGECERQVARLFREETAKGRAGTGRNTLCKKGGAP